MATTEHFRNGGGTTFNFVFPILANSDLKVEIYNATTGVWDLKTENPSGTTDGDYTISNTNVVFNSATPSGTGNVHIYRTTNVDNPAAVFAAGSSIRAVDLNNNQTQVLYSTQEAVDQVIRETDLKDSIITSAKIANGSIVNDDINASAAIDGTKITPNFGSQNILGSRQLRLTGTDDLGTGDIHLSGGSDGTAVITVTESANNVSKLIIDGKGNGTGGAVNGAGPIAAFTMTNATPSVDVIGNLNVDGTTTLGTTNNTTLTNTGKLKVNSITSVTENGSNYTLSGAHITVGTDDTNALQIFHSPASNHSFISEVGPGDLCLVTNGTNLFLQKDATSGHAEDMIQCIADGPVKLFHNNQLKLATESTGIEITGNVDLDGITGDGVVTTGTSISDTKVYSAKRAGEIIDARIIELVDEVGGFVPIANETSFPNANPDVNDGPGTLISIASLSNTLSADEFGVITITNGTVGNSTVTINGATAGLNYTAGFGIIVETTSTLNTYTFHRYVPNATSVTTISSNLNHLIKVADIDADVTKVANIDANVTKVANIDTNVTKVADIDDKVTTVANNNTNVSNVGDSIINVNTVATSIENVNSVATDATDIGAVAGKATEIGRLGTADAVADLAILGTTDVVADMNTLGTSSNVTNMNTLAGISENLTTVAGISSDVTTVATTVAPSIGNVNTTAGSIANVNTTAGSIANVNTVATNITNVNTASTYLNNFLALYLGEAATAPSVDTFGNPVTEGDFYFNTVNKQLQVFNGSVFTSIFAFAFDIEKAATAAFNALYTAAVGQNTINLGGLAITGAVFGDEKIATNRVSLIKGSATYNLGGI